MNKTELTKESGQSPMVKGSWEKKNEMLVSALKESRECGELTAEACEIARDIAEFVVSQNVKGQGCAADREDLVSDAMLVLAERWRDIELGKVASLIYAVTYRRVQDYYKKKKEMLPPTEEWFQDTAEEQGYASDGYDDRTVQMEHTDEFVTELIESGEIETGENCKEDAVSYSLARVMEWGLLMNYSLSVIWTVWSGYYTWSSTRSKDNSRTEMMLERILWSFTEDWKRRLLEELSCNRAAQEQMRAWFESEKPKCERWVRLIDCKARKVRKELEWLVASGRLSVGSSKS